ncbi:MAG TPA: translation initiation factor IF-2 [Nitrospiraceae bacterium]|nr:translation initiation factor IF-2 [Nitrospiraceae bacterium]
MSKARVYDLAKKLGVNNKELIVELERMGIKGKTHSSSIEDDLVLKLTRIFTKKEKLPAKKPMPLEKVEKKVEKEIKEVGRKTEEVKEEVEKEKELEISEAKKEIIEESTLPVEKPAAVEVEEEVKIPDRFKKEVEVERVEKFKGKPGMQRAFETIKRVEVKKWREVKPFLKKHERGKVQHQKVEVKVLPLPIPIRKKVLKLHEGTTLKEFAEMIGQKLPEVIKKFMELGYMLTINQPVDGPAAQIVAESFGIKIELAPVGIEDLGVEETEDVYSLIPRPPIITIMGHVDHGKTSLLDAIRQTKVTEMEAGGITQHIGAYKVRLKGKDIVFLDTPGHEAFTAMRARGAKVTDIVVLVIAADDGVMPQTIEAINHAKAANVPIVVAVNKIDKPEANPAKIRNELAEHGIVSEEWGGQNIFVEVSAKKRIGIEKLLEMILLQAEVMELKANPSRQARGAIIEAKLDRGRGPVATVLVQSGTLKAGDAFVAGAFAGKVRALIDDDGRKVEAAGPATPVEVIGFSEVPQAGDVFIAMDDERKARQIALARLQKQRLAGISKARKLTLDDLYAKIKEEGIKELNIVIKGDVQGTVEAIKDAMEHLSHPQVKVKVIHASAGGINESDVMLASASQAIILGFNVRPETKAYPLAEKEGVDIRMYNVIYDAIEDIKKALEGLLEPTVKERVLGRAEVRQVFQVSRFGTIAGCYVLDGFITRSSTGIRVIRDNIVVYDGKIASLKRFKEDVKEIQAGYECGILVENFNDVKVGDVLENYLMEQVAARLS